MKNKIVIFGLVSVLTMGTTVGVLAKNQNRIHEDENDVRVEQSKEKEKDDIEVNTKNIKIAVTEEAAKKIAMDSVIDGTFIEIELEDEEGLIIYEVEIKSGDLIHEIEIDAITGTILKDDIDDDDDNEVINTNVKLTENEAIEIAKKLLGANAEVIEVEFEKEDGIIIYDIELNIDNKEFDIEIDANTGQIVSQEEDKD